MIKPCSWLVVPLTLFLNPFRSAQAAPPQEIKRIINAGKIVVAMHRDDRVPFFMHDGSGNFIGYDVEIANDIAKKLGVKVEFLRTAKFYDDVVTQIEKGEADLGISKLSF